MSHLLAVKFREIQPVGTARCRKLAPQLSHHCACAKIMESVQRFCDFNFLLYINTLVELRPLLYLWVLERSGVILTGQHLWLHLAETWHRPGLCAFWLL